MEIDSIEIKIQSDAENANKKLDDLIKKIGLVKDGISAVGNSQGFKNLFSQAQNISKSMSSVGTDLKKSMQSVEPQMQKMSKNISEIAKDFQNKFKDTPVKVDFSRPEAELEKFKKQAQTAENSLSRIMQSSSADKQTKSIEKWSISLAQAQNAVKLLEDHIGGLKSQMESVSKQKATEGIKIDGEKYIVNFKKELADTKATIEKFKNVYGSLANIPKGMLDRPIEGLTESLTELKSAYPQATNVIADFEKILKELQGVSGNLRERITPKVDTREIEGTEQKLNNFSSQLQNMADLMKRAFTFSAIRDVENWNQLADSVKNYIKNAQVAAGIKVYTNDYKNVFSDIERTETELEKLDQKKRNMQASGMSKESKDWQTVTSQIETAQRRLEQYTAQRYRMEGTGTDVKFSGGLANQSWIKSMGAVAGEAISSLRQRISEIGGAVSQAVGKIPIIGRIAKEAAFLGQTAFNGLKFAVSGVASVAQKAVAGLSRITSAISKLASSIKGAISKFTSLAKSMLGIKSASKGMNGSFSGGFKTILKYGLGIRSLFVLFNRLRTAAKDAFKNLAQYSPETNAAISSLSSSLGALKNSLATAFAPILNVVAPILSTFIDLLTRAFNAIGRFFAALTGKSFAVQSVKSVKDYAAGISKTGGAAKKAAKDIKTYTLGIDELNIITEDENEGSGAGGGASELLPEDMFETVEIEDKFKKWADWLKEMWANADFYELGKLLGEKLKNALDSIDWEPIKETAGKIGKSVATLINGFVEVEWLADSIGKTIGEAINTGITGINAFLDNTHWDSVGIFIGEGLNGIVNTIDWSGLGHLFAAKWNAIFETIGEAARTFDWSNFGLQLATSVNTFIKDFKWAENGAHLGELIKGLLDTLISFLEETDWQSLGNGVADFIGSIDWTGIFERLSEGIGAALGGLAAFLWGLIENAWNNVVSWWNETAFEDGEFTMKGLLNGILEGLKNIGAWIKEHIFDPFINGFKTAFGIASPSKIMIEMGEYLIQGLINGILGAWESLKEKVGEVASSVIEKFRNVLGIHSPSTVMDEQGIYLMEGLRNGIESSIDSVYALFSPETWTEIGTNMFNALMATVENFKILWAESFALWMEESVIPAFSEETWFEATDGMSLGITSKWLEFEKLWKSNFDKWWKIQIVPFFSLKQWQEFGTNMKNGIYAGFKGIVMQIGGIINGLVVVFNQGISNIAAAMNDLISQFNRVAEELGVATLPHVSPKAIQKIPIPELATGGIIMDDMILRAGEYGRKEAILPLENKSAMGMIAESLMEYGFGRSEYSEEMMREQNELLREQNALLMQIAEKELIIGDEDIAEANRRGEERLGFNFTPSYA